MCCWAESDGILLGRLPLNRGMLSSEVLKDIDFSCSNAFVLSILCLERMEQTHSPVLILMRPEDPRIIGCHLVYPQINVRTMVDAKNPSACGF